MYFVHQFWGRLSPPVRPPSHVHGTCTSPGVRTATILSRCPLWSQGASGEHAAEAWEDVATRTCEQLAGRLVRQGYGAWMAQVARNLTDGVDSAAYCAD